MEINLLKTLLSTEVYENHQQRIRRSIFADEHLQILDLIVEGHSKYENDLQPDDLFAMWMSQNPMATSAIIHDFRDILDNLKTAPAITEAVADDIIQSLWRQEIGRDVASLGINMAEGDSAAMTKLKRLIENVADSYMPDDFGEDCDADIDELMAFTSNENKWQFNIPTLSRELYGVGPGNFGAIFARTEAGKTCFSISLCAGPGGFASQGAKVFYLCNEEDVQITKLRGMQSWAGVSAKECITRSAEVRGKFKEIDSNMRFREINGWNVDKLDAFLTKFPADVVILDQIDKLEISGTYDGLHRKLGALYQSVRELAKRHRCAILCVTQASIEAENRTRVEASMMADSKTSKQAELDLIIGIGMSAPSNDGPDPRRFLNLSKNKLSPFHGMINCTIEPLISRYNV